jgi:hypothetical protein
LSPAVTTFADGVPHRDLLLSLDHAVFTDAVPERLVARASCLDEPGTPNRRQAIRARGTVP